MKNAAVAVRYAKALIECSDDATKREAWLNELRTLDAGLHQAGDAFRLLHSGDLTHLEAREIVEALISKVSVSAEVRNLLRLIADRGRLNIFPEIVACYQQEFDKRNNVMRGEVLSPAPLTPEEKKNLEATIEKTVGKKVILQFTEDKSLVGGLLAKVGSYAFDGSINTQIKLMNEELKRRAH